ncbi:MAG: maleylpyruvate isomerase N-terminal domain-containing protein, partial [Chloroflexota bacterium]|nr:maleylpyruvate isomerase N-terminal domain-containing protein [Chloroflexota bacterium]
MPVDELSTALVCGEWTTKDLMGHVAVWDAVAIDKIREIHEGVPWQRIATDERNAREAAARADQPLDAQRAEMQMTHQRLLSALAAVEHLPADTLAQIGDA